MSKQWVGILILIATLTALFVYLKYRSIPVTTDPASNITLALEGVNAVYAPDQAPGKTILVSQIVLENPGFVAIHRADDDGEPGAIFATSDLLPGNSEDVIITLADETRVGDEFYAILHADDGDGVFSPDKDLPIRDADGRTVMSSFEILVRSTTPDVSL